MALKEKVFVAGMGMITSVGGDTKMTTASVEAGISRYTKSDYVNRRGKPLTMALVPEDALPDDESEQSSIQSSMVLRMAVAALDEVFQNYADEKPVPLFFSGPETFAGCTNQAGSNLLTHIIEHAGGLIDKEESRLVQTGRAGVIECIDLANSYFALGAGDCILVGGADCYQNEELLAFLDKDNRLLAEDSLGGFVPGEAAGFLLLTTNEERAMKLGGKIRLSDPGISAEPGHMYSDDVYRGDGLAQAVSAALNSEPTNKIERVYSSMNGEQFWAREYGVAYLRNKNFFAEDFFLEHPADCFGDTGGACGALLIGLSAQELLSKKPPLSNLVYCSSDQSGRAAIRVSREL